MDANEDTGEDAAAQQERRRVRVNRLLLLHIFQSTVQHVVTIQSEMLLFLRACDGDAASATRIMTNTAAVTGILSLVVNQVGGKISDAIGRKPIFLTGPIINAAVGITVFTFPSAIWTLALGKVLKTAGTTLSGTVVSFAAFMDVNSPT